MLDIMIKNGLIYDGTGNPPTKLNVGIKDGKIIHLDYLKDRQAKKVIDAENMAISPGFIDTHTHSDLIITKPEIHNIKVMQGVTTELLGQDGTSAAPVNSETKALWQKQLKGLNGDIGDWPWETVEEYLDYLDKTPIAGNALYLVPHGGIRTLVMGFAERVATDEELEKMTFLAEEGMQQGAVGVSSGLIYPPNVFCDTREVIALCKGAAKYDGVFVVHIRNEANGILEALDEVIGAARKTGVRLHVSHFKIVGSKNRDKFKPVLEKIDKARKEGIEITFDQYPYTAGSTVFHSLLPPWMHSGGTDEMLKKLKDKGNREKIIQDIKNDDSYENWALYCGWENVVINTVSTKDNKYTESKNMAEIAKIRNQEPEDTVIDLIIEEDANITMTIHWGIEDDIIYGMKHPLQMVCSDGIFGGKPHPRLYGSFPKVLGQYVRDEGFFPLSEGVRKMTGAPAQMLRLKDRGYLREGYWADIVIFDPKEIKSNATYEDPIQFPSGINYVIVNGKITVENGKYMGKTNGKVIRRL